MMRSTGWTTLAALTLVGASCGGGATADGDEITVFAAASLTDAFTEIGASFEASHAGTTVRFNFAGSSDLAGQILQGAPADVSASADVANMTRLTDADATDGVPAVFATNRSEIIVEPGNPMAIAGADDLATEGLIVVTCAPEVPCGSYASQIFENAGVDVAVDSYEANVRGVVTKVTLGEADAGIVYATDVLAAGDAALGVPLPDDINVTADYPIAVTRDADDPELAREFVDFVTGSEGQTILANYGFGAP